MIKASRLLFAFAVALCVLPAAISLAQQPSGLRGITPEDYFSFEFISDPNLSPDGKFVAYVLTKIDRSQNRRFGWWHQTAAAPPGSLLPARNRRLRLAGVLMENGSRFYRPGLRANQPPAPPRQLRWPAQHPQNKIAIRFICSQ